MSNPGAMKLSTRARYALRAMLAISRLSEDGRPVSLDRVARKTHLSKRYLEQLAGSLRQARLLTSVAGRKGGYLLARPPQQIHIGQIIEAAIGPINIVACVRQPEVCLSSEWCDCRLIFAWANYRLLQSFNEHSLADLSDKNWRGRIQRDLATATYSPEREPLA
jgi:Rrf2 family protein